MKNRKPVWRTSFVVLTFAAVLSVGGCKEQETSGEPSSAANSAAQSQIIKLGLNTSMTGPTATFGKNSHKGIEMAIDEANARGGVLRHQIQLIVEDNSGKADQALTAVQKLISADNVLAVLGDIASSNSLAAAPACQKAGVPMVSPSSTNPKVTKIGDYIFRTCFIDPFQGTVCARFAAQTLKAKTVAILIDNKSDYSRGLAQYFVADFSKKGKVVATSYYSGGDNDFRAQLTSIKAKQPDILFVPGYYTEVGLIAVQARDLGMKQPLLGGDGWDSPKLSEIGKQAIEGGYFSTHYSAESKSPRVQKFVADFKQKFKGETPDALAAVAYDSTNILLAAITKSGGSEPTAENRKKIRDALAATSKFPGVTGDISINAERNAIKPAVMLQIRNKKFVYVETVQPYP